MIALSFRKILPRMSSILEMLLVNFTHLAAISVYMSISYSGVHFFLLSLHFVALLLAF